MLQKERELGLVKNKKPGNGPITFKAELQFLPLEESKELDPRVRRTRQLIIQAFSELLEEKGFQNVTVGDIAARATINRATFYAHFVDKYALLDHIVRESFQQTLYAKLSVNCEINLENLRLLILTTIEYLKQFHSSCAKVHEGSQPFIEAQVQKLLYEFILNWFKQLKPGQLPPNTVPEITASAVSWTIFGVSLEWGQGSKQHSIEQVANQIVILISEGLSPLTNRLPLAIR